jgi:hypothetical protein
MGTKQRAGDSEEYCTVVKVEGLGGNGMATRKVTTLLCIGLEDREVTQRWRLKVQAVARAPQWCQTWRRWAWLRRRVSEGKTAGEKSAGREQYKG